MKNEILGRILVPVRLPRSYCKPSSIPRRPHQLPQTTMDLASALQRLANYRTKNSRASREIFESGVVVFRNDALRKLGDDSAFSL